MLKVLVYSKDNLVESSTLKNYLAKSNKIEPTYREALNDSGQLFDFEVVVLANALPLNPEFAEDLVKYVRKGGKLVCLGDSTDNWADWESLATSFGAKKGRRTPLTELIVRVPGSANHPLTNRLYAGYAHDHYAGLDRDTAFPLFDSFYLSENPHKPEEGREAVLLVSWHSARLPVAWVQTHGRGKLFSTGLGINPATWENPVFQQLVFRAIMHTTGQEKTEPVRVAMLGYGAIGYEHGSAAKQVPGLEFAAVCDRNNARLEEASRHFSGLKTYLNAREVADDPDIDLVIVSTPPNTHAEMALEMLSAGKHVVVEKPFCITTREADALIEKAGQNDLTLTVYQCRRWDADYLAIKAVVDEGLIGEVFHLETFIGGFHHPCDYWHSHEPVSGGVFYDWGSHYLDWVLGLMPGRVQSVSGFAHKRVWHDVTNEDQAGVIMRFNGGQEAHFIHSDIAAAMKPKWYILGTKGAIVGQWRVESVNSRKWNGDLIEERLAPSEVLPELTAYLRRDNLIHEQKLSLPPAPVLPFHRNLANHLLVGEPLAVTPQEARRNIAVMEAAKYSAGHGGQFITLNC
jgi:scyllo-inositol 2-dehydrogenase (NADP+)